MPRRFYPLLCLNVLLFSVLLLTGCSGDPGHGPVEPKWDRTVCERCRMVLSDRKHSAQIREPRPDGRSKIRNFDDIGCAVIWLEEKSWKDDPRTEIWVTDHRSGEWIDARKANYIKGQITPMEYGLGAQTEPLDGGLDYQQAKAFIFEMEERFNTHGAHLQSDAAARK